jgi:hypothetical protein
MDKVIVIETYDADGKEWGISLDGPNPHPDKYFTMSSQGAAIELARLLNQPAASPASPVREALEKINEIFEAPDYSDSVIKRYNDIKKIVLAARTEGDGWIELKEGCVMPDYDTPMLWLFEDGLMQVHDLDKDGNPWLYGGEAEGFKFAPATHYRPLPSPPKTT